MEASDTLMLAGILVSFATAFAAIVVSLRSDHRQRRERAEDLRGRAAEAAAVPLTYLHIYAVNAVPQTREGSEGRFDDWRRRMEAQFSLVYQELTKLKLTTSSPTVHQGLDEALALLPSLAADVEHGIRLLSRQDGAASDAWVASEPKQRRLLAIHEELASLLSVRSDPDG
jgi:hypothetical protein